MEEKDQVQDVESRRKFLAIAGKAAAAAPAVALLLNAERAHAQAVPYGQTQTGGAGCNTLACSGSEE
ncbi:MAG: hypothetical protein KDG55_05905 [Rhodocyclaceae bacterium]|nr:hypothetical protein [Rhodocyclaceae bacterium]